MAVFCNKNKNIRNDQIFIAGKQGLAGGEFLPALRSQTINLSPAFANRLLVFNRCTSTKNHLFVFKYLDESVTRDASSYFRIRYDPRTICQLAKLLKENHRALSVS